MIAAGMPVQIRRCGTAVPVEQLVIGDLLYDPLADTYIGIVDILSRDTARLGHRLARIPADRFGKDRPRQDVILSRQQPVAYPDRTQGTRSPCLEFDAAHHLGEELRLETRLYALFPERPGCISVAGALLHLSDPSVPSVCVPDGVKGRLE